MLAGASVAPKSIVETVALYKVAFTIGLLEDATSRSSELVNELKTLGVLAHKAFLCASGLRLEILEERKKWHTNNQQPDAANGVEGIIKNECKGMVNHSTNMMNEAESKIQSHFLMFSGVEDFGNRYTSSLKIQKTSIVAFLENLGLSKDEIKGHYQSAGFDYGPLGSYITRSHSKELPPGFQHQAALIDAKKISKASWIPDLEMHRDREIAWAWFQYGAYKQEMAHNLLIARTLPQGSGKPYMHPIPDSGNPNHCWKIRRLNDDVRMIQSLASFGALNGGGSSLYFDPDPNPANPNTLWHIKPFEQFFMLSPFVKPNACLNGNTSGTNAYIHDAANPQNPYHLWEMDNIGPSKVMLKCKANGFVLDALWGMTKD